ncbi:MAG: low molecular weight protein-tyrosine-phosphatase [Bdellovibrionota bacterium]
MIKLLFVCLGNICRSPTAEGVMQSLVDERGLSNMIICDSAGTIGYHAGSPADERMREHASKRGYDLTSLSRKFVKSDFKNFDLILVMDSSNYKDVLGLDSKNQYSEKVRLLTDYCSEHNVDEVPDPYYGGAADFELVLDIVEDACSNLLEELN